MQVAVQCMTDHELLTHSLQMDWRVWFVNEYFVQFMSWSGQSFHYYFDAINQVWCP